MSFRRPPASPARRLLDALRERWRDTLHGLVSDSRFQRRVASVPFASTFARKHAASLFDLCAGFVYSQVLLACVRLRLLERLADGPRTAAELAAQTELSVDAMERLLEAARGLGLIEARAEGRYALALDGAAYLGNPGLAKMIEHHAMLYRDLADPVALLRDAGAPDTELRRFWAYEGASTAEGAAYSELMATSLPLLADDVLDAYPLRRGRILDVGGGKGELAAALLARAPALDVALFDLPSVVPLAEAHLRAQGLERVRLIAGDARRDPLPGPADAVTLCRILHDHDDDDALALLERARAALAPGGALLVAEPMATDGARDPVASYFGFYFLAMGQGRLRSPYEVATLLRRAGCARAEERPTRQPLLARLVVGFAPTGP
jgi:demethylspheroidene O-methyltransferase